MADAAILHADLDAFYASVAQRDDPSLRGRPVVVGQGVVLAASYEARVTGVRSGMPGGEARRRCPHAVVVPTDFAAYSQASRAVFEIFRTFTPNVEPLSIDEAFLDVAGALRLFGTPLDIAAALRARVRDEVGLPLSVGIARTKFLAKVASAQAKPDGCLLVPPDGELAFLHPLPVRALWGVGPKTAEVLARKGIETVGDLAELPEAVLTSLLGGAVGRHLHALAWNHDPRSVEPHRRDRSISSQRALGRRPRTEAEVREILLGLSDRVTSRVRKAGLVTRTVTVSMRFHDMSRTARSHTFDEPTDESGLVARKAVELAASVLFRRSERADPRDHDVTSVRSRATVLDVEGVSLLGVRCSNLGRRDTVQMALPLRGPASVRRRELDERVDAIRERFGRDALTRGALLDSSPGLEVLARPTALDHDDAGED